MIEKEYGCSWVNFIFPFDLVNCHIASRTWSSNSLRWEERYWCVGGSRWFTRSVVPRLGLDSRDALLIASEPHKSSRLYVRVSLLVSTSLSTYILFSFPLFSLDAYLLSSSPSGNLFLLFILFLISRLDFLCPEKWTTWTISVPNLLWPSIIGTSIITWTIRTKNYNCFLCRTLEVDPCVSRRWIAHIGGF